MKRNILCISCLLILFLTGCNDGVRNSATTVEKIETGASIGINSGIGMMSGYENCATFLDLYARNKYLTELNDGFSMYLSTLYLSSENFPIYNNLEKGYHQSQFYPTTGELQDNNFYEICKENYADITKLIQQSPKSIVQFYDYIGIYGKIVTIHTSGMDFKWTVLGEQASGGVYIGKTLFSGGIIYGVIDYSGNQNMQSYSGVVLKIYDFTGENASVWEAAQYIIEKEKVPLESCNVSFNGDSFSFDLKWELQKDTNNITELRDVIDKLSYPCYRGGHSFSYFFDSSLGKIIATSHQGKDGGGVPDKQFLYYTLID